ncbi:MAG: hypothetical protein K0Q58_1293 [Microbacterium sp.]|nr:hypothetical protein [Microbacterium sp.]
MTVTTAARPSRPVGHDPLRGGLRFLAELVAWVAVPWALWPHSPVLAIAAVLVLVVPPAVFGTLGDRNSRGGARWSDAGAEPFVG